MTTPRPPDETPRRSARDISTRATRVQLERSLGMIIIDYLQLLTSTGRRKENRQQEVSEISRELKILAKDLNIPVIALSQLSREIEHRNPPVPVLSDLRDSGSIEQDADLVMCMYRGDIFEPHTNVGAKLLVLKQRNGPTGQTASAFAIHWWGVKTTLPKPHKPWDINASHHKIWGIFPLYVALLLVEHPYAKQDPVNSPHMYRNRWRGLHGRGAAGVSSRLRPL